MTKLMDMNLGFNNLEHFNESLHLEIKSEKLRRKILEGKNPEKKVVKEAMLLKVRDEEEINKEIDKELRTERWNLKAEHGENTRKSRTLMRKLNKEAQGMRKK